MHPSTAAGMKSPRRLGFCARPWRAGDSHCDRVATSHCDRVAGGGCHEAYESWTRCLSQTSGEGAPNADGPCTFDGRQVIEGALSVPPQGEELARQSSVGAPKLDPCLASLSGDSFHQSSRGPPAVSGWTGVEGAASHTSEGARC